MKEEVQGKEVFVTSKKQSVGVEMPELASLAAEVYDLKQKQKQIESAIMEKEDQLKRYMSSTERAVAGKYILTCQTIITKRFDATALKESDAETYNKYLTESSTKRLTVKEKDSD